MMRQGASRYLRLGLTIGATMLVSADEPPASAPAATSPDAILREQGLKPSGSTYVLAAEAQLQKQLNTVRDRYRVFVAGSRQQQYYEQGSRDSAVLIRELTQRRLVLNRQLSMASSVAEHNQIVMMFNEVNDQINLLNQDANNPDFKKDIAARVAETRESFIQTLLDTRTLVDEAQARYKELADSPTVTGSLDALNQAPKNRVKWVLGPSRGFLENIKQLEKLEHAVLTESIPLRDDGNGVFLVDVMLNGKVTKGMILDTGASLVCLSSKVAAEIGLKPDADTRTIKATIADGSTVEARLMKIPTVRVGKFVVNNVECAVAPPDQPNAPLLLGGSFLRSFVHHIKPDKAELTLTRIDTGPEIGSGNSTTPRGKATSRSAVKRGTGR